LVFDVQVSRDDGLLLSRASLGLPDLPSHGFTLSHTLARIDRAVRTSGTPDVVDLAEILAPAARTPDLLDGIALTPSSERYTRHLLHQGIGYSVLALVWMPGQVSPVHAHRTWCVLAVQQGCLTETLFRREAGRITADPARPLRSGDVSHSQATMTEAHQVANLSTEMAVSIHIYGAPFERLGQDVNHIWTS